MRCEFVADDYGIFKEINEAIIDLSRRNVISKIGVMQGDHVIIPDTQIAQKVQTGLHINLTSNTGNEERGTNRETSPFRLFYRCYIKREINIDHLLDIILSQAEFVESKGIRISYLDTHMHVHILPKVLMALVIFAKIKGINFIRCITMRKLYLPFYFYSLIRYGFITQVPKLFILYSMGFIMKRTLDKHQIQYSKNLVLMPLALKGDYAGLMKSFYRMFKDKDAEIVTHPGLIQGTGFDEYREGRKIEYEALQNINNGRTMVC
jgi:hypothetical protein